MIEKKEEETKHYWSINNHHLHWFIKDWLKFTFILQDVTILMYCLFYGKTHDNILK